LKHTERIRTGSAIDVIRLKVLKGETWGDVGREKEKGSEETELWGNQKGENNPKVRKMVFKRRGAKEKVEGSEQRKTIVESTQRRD